MFRRSLLALPLVAPLAAVTACTSSPGGPPPAKQPASGSAIVHVVLIEQENHTFDSYFGNWCTAPAGSNPTCTSGPSCCEAAPAKDPAGSAPVVLDDMENAKYDPIHLQSCELSEQDGGKMDRYTSGASCSDPRNFAVAPTSLMAPYIAYAENGALADRYFQPMAGQSDCNTLYLATSHFVFLDDIYEPDAIGKQCAFTSKVKEFSGTTIGDLLLAAGYTVSVYAEGFDDMKAAGACCPPAPAACPLGLPVSPCVYDPSDNPFEYFSSMVDKHVEDYDALAQDLADGALPSFSIVRSIGYKQEHPGSGFTITAGEDFVTKTVDAIESSPDKDDTLVLLTWDEGGGYFDHVSPPDMSSPGSKVDGQPYGTRIPLIVIGPFAKKGTISHVMMEHSSIVRFLEWNFLGQTGQLEARDAVVANIGSLLDPAATGVTVPVN